MVLNVILKKIEKNLRSSSSLEFSHEILVNMVYPPEYVLEVACREKYSHVSSFLLEKKVFVTDNCLKNIAGNGDLALFEQACSDLTSGRRENLHKFCYDALRHDHVNFFEYFFKEMEANQTACLSTILENGAKKCYAKFMHDFPDFDPCRDVSPEEKHSVSSLWQRWALQGNFNPSFLDETCPENIFGSTTVLDILAEAGDLSRLREHAMRMGLLQNGALPRDTQCHLEKFMKAKDFEILNIFIGNIPEDERPWEEMFWHALRDGWVAFVSKNIKCLPNEEDQFWKKYLGDILRGGNLVIIDFLFNVLPNYHEEITGKVLHSAIKKGDLELLVLVLKRYGNDLPTYHLLRFFQRSAARASIAYVLRLIHLQGLDDVNETDSIKQEADLANLRRKIDDSMYDEFDFNRYSIFA